MTTGPDHYRLAEDLLAQSHSIGADDLTPAELLAATLAEAQVHATLALAAAAALAPGGEEVGPDYYAWFSAAGTRPVAAQS